MYEGCRSEYEAKNKQLAEWLNRLGLEQLQNFAIYEVQLALVVESGHSIVHTTITNSIAQAVFNGEKGREE